MNVWDYVAVFMQSHPVKLSHLGVQSLCLLAGPMHRQILQLPPLPPLPV